MNKTPFDTSHFDSRLDALLGSHPVRASKSFTADTLKRLRETPEISDEALDRLLGERPATPAANFTTSTLRRISHRDNIITFMRPALAAAASIAICMTGIWTFDRQAGDAASMTASTQHGDIEELAQLADSLGKAAPLLDTGTADALACLIDSK